MSFNVRILYPGKDDWDRELKRIQVDKYAMGIFHDKREKILVKVSDVRVEVANIIKQDALSSGCDAVVPRMAISGKPDICSVIIVADRRSLDRLRARMESQPFSLAKLSAVIEERLDTGRCFLRFREKQIGLETPLVMGILNVTPDSFYDGGRHMTIDETSLRAEKMIREGVDIIDVGGESTRPGSEKVSLADELDRVVPAVKAVRQVSADIPLSVDTYKSEVARKAFDAGADIINDVSGGTFDVGIFHAVAEYGGACVIMHIKGTPRDMQKEPLYEDVMDEIYGFLHMQTEKALSAGIGHDSIITDPGIGFGKRHGDNLELIRRLKEFSGLGYPVLAGLSRKSFIGRLTGREPGERLCGTAAANAMALAAGADILRVHDVSCAVDTVKVVKGILYGE